MLAQHFGSETLEELTIYVLCVADRLDSVQACICVHALLDCVRLVVARGGCAKCQEGMLMYGVCSAAV